MMFVIPLGSTWKSRNESLEDLFVKVVRVQDGKSFVILSSLFKKR